MNLARHFFANPTPVQLLLLTALVGVGGAFGAIVFHFLISLSSYVFFGLNEGADFISLVEALPVWYRLLVPTLGGLLVGLIFTYSKIYEAEGEGVPEVMEALAVKRGNIRPWVAPIKTLTSAITIGSGGSAGREGPIIQIGSAIGSNIGQYLRLGTVHTSMLLAAGAAAGIAGTFGTPLAGVIFCSEVLFRKITVFNYFQLLLAALIGASVTKLLVGHNGLELVVQSVPLIQIKEIIFFAILGVLAGIVATVLGFSLKGTTRVFSQLRLHHVLKPALGGFMIGCIALLIPQIHEQATYPVMVDILKVSTLPLTFLMLLLVAKIISTSLTLGSGGSGGIFAPALLIGIVLGSAFSTLLGQIGMLGIDGYVYALAGMAAVFAAAAHAPFTAVIILFEMTGETLLIIPLAISCFVATFVAKKLSPDSIYRKH